MLADVNDHRKYGTKQQRWKITRNIYNKTKNHWKLWNYTKNYNFRSISEMGALYVNYLQKNIQNVFGWIYNTVYVLNALDGQNH